MALPDGKNVTCIPSKTEAKSKVTTSKKKQKKGSTEIKLVENDVIAAESQVVDMELVDRAFKMAVDIDSGCAMLSRLAEALRKLDPTFDNRNYGFSTFRKFCDELKPDYEIFKGVDRTTLFIREAKSKDES